MYDKDSLAAFKLALGLVKAKGIASQNRDGVEMLIYQTELLSVAFIPAKEERPNGLDVWQHGDHSTKVLDVIWTDGTMPLILAYHGGTWEKLLRPQLPECPKFLLQNELKNARVSRRRKKPPVARCAITAVLPP